MLFVAHFPCQYVHDGDRHCPRSRRQIVLRLAAHRLPVFLGVVSSFYRPESRPKIEIWAEFCLVLSVRCESFFFPLPGLRWGRMWLEGVAEGRF